MASRNVDGEIVVGINQPESLKVMNEDLKKILSQIKDLEARISHAKLDKTAVEELLSQIRNLKAEINISNVKINQTQITGDVQQTGQKMGKQMGDNINQGLSKSLRDVKYAIADTIKNFPKLTGFSLSNIFNLNRKDIDSSVTKQIHDITKEIETLSAQVLKTNSDSSWEGVIDKINSLRNILNQFGQIRDTSSFKESIDLLDYFNNKKIYVGDKAEVLQNTGMTLRELNKEFMNLVKFTTSAKGSIKLDTIWDELASISPGLEKFITFGDQIEALVAKFKIAKEAMYGNGGLQPAANTNEVPNILMKYMDILENTSKKLSALRGEQAEIEQMIADCSTAFADKVVQNEQKKQEAYKQTAEAQKQAAQEIKNATGDYEKAIKDVTSPSIEKYFKVDASTSAQFKAEMEKLVSVWSNGMGKLTDIKIDTRTVYDKDVGENVEKLRQAVVTYKNELNEVIKKTIAWRQIGTTTNAKGEEVALRGFVEVAGQYSKALDTAATKTDTFIERQQKAVASAQNTLSTIESKLNDPNSTKSLAGTDFNANGLNEQLERVKIAISALDNASKNTFTQAQIDVNKEITSLKNLIATLKNAEYAATSLRTKGLDTTKEVYASKLDVIVTKMKSSGIYTNGFQNGAENLKNILRNATDTSGLTVFLNGLDKLEAGYKRAEASAKAFNQAQKVGIDVSGLQSQIADLQRMSPEIDKFKAKINGADVTVQSLYNDLSKVNTKSDFSVMQKKWNAFEKAAKAAGIAVTEVGTNVSRSGKAAAQLLKELETSYQNIKNLQIKKSTLDPIVDSSKIAKLNEEIAKAKNNYSNAFRSASKNDNFDFSVWKEVKTAIDSATKSKIEYNNAGKTDYLNGQNNNLSDTLSNLKSLLQESGLYTDELNQKITTLESELVNISNKGDLSTFKANLKSVESEVGTLLQASKIQYSMDTGEYESKVETLIAKTRRLTDENGNARISTIELSAALNELTLASKAYASNPTETTQKILIESSEKLVKEYETVANSVRKMNAELTKTTDAAKSAGKQSKSLFASLKSGMGFFSYWTSAHYIFMRIVRGIKEVINNVHELDDALTNIAYTMDVNGSQLKQIGESSLQAAKDLHTSVSKVLDAVKTYSNMTETAESIIEKSKPTIMMSNVTGMDTSQTVDILQGVMEQFELAEDKLMHISDVMQTVSMSMPYDFADGVKELSEGIKASGSVAKDAGYDLENYTALLGTLIAKTRQSGGELGRSLRTMFVRTTKASTSALASGEVTEDDLSNAEKALRRVGIEVRSDLETFKSFDEIMGELYQKIDSLSDVDLSNIAYEVASTRQTNVFKMMIKAYGDYQEMAEKAYNADNVTLENQEKYAASLSGKLGEISATWEKISNDAVSSDFLKGLADIGIGLSSLVEKAGLFKTAMGIGIVGIFGKGRSNDFAL